MTRKHHSATWICSYGCPSRSYLGNTHYFLVIELLDHAFDYTLKQLRHNEKRHDGSVGESWVKKLCLGSKTLSKRQKLRLFYRLQDFCIPVASAMHHLHKHKIIYRDLKPANIGFNALEGTLKVFDLGLACEIVDQDRRLTGATGSTQYMAPENAWHEHYGFPADVYSFGIFLWETLTTLKKPFG